LLAAWSEWGTDCLTRLVGMFAFAVFDRQENALWLARDFFGIKPLFYAVTERGIAFASEIKTLLETFDVSRTVNPERLYLYLRFGITGHGGETLFQQVRQLPAAHVMRIDLATLTAEAPRRYWRLPRRNALDIGFDEAARTVREMFLENVALHLRSDVPVGAALSGGIDSSSIVMAMRHLMGDRLDLHLISFIADEERVCEDRWIDIIGQASGGTVHKVRSGSSELLSDLKRLTGTHDEPIGSTSIYAQMRVFQAAREHGVTVMLDGQGADELLGGYRTYLGARLASLLRQGRLVDAQRFWKRCSHLPGSGRLTLLMQCADFLLPSHLQAPLRRLVGRGLSPKWLNMRWFHDRGVRAASVNSPRSRDVLREQLRREVEELSLPHLLRYEDRNSMAFSIESRVPFLTPRLAEFLLSLPEEYLIAPDGTSKAVFRAAMRGIVPDAVLDRKDKIGFATPEREWLTALSPWVQATLSDDAGGRVAALNLPEAHSEWQRVTRGQRRFDFRIWRWLNVIEWSRAYGVVYA
ncbi:MAG: asparagine synthase (glutamine-hydrolyzing), partial [Planctomycetaceae bacterium]